MLSTPRHRRLLVAGCLLILAASSVLNGAFASAATRQRSAPVPRTQHTHAQPVTAGHWVASWTAASEAPAPGSSPAGGFRDQTVRNVVFTSAGGTMARVRLTNTLGTRPLVIGRAAVGLAGAGAAVVPNTNMPLTFAGSSSVVIPPGGEAVSDPVHLLVRPLEELAVSIYLPGPTGPPTQHTHAHQITYLAAGDHALDIGPGGFPTRTLSWYFLSGVDVWSPARELGAVVALGDSITDGVGTLTNANGRWPNDLARRFAVRPGPTLSVIDAGIGGNRVLNPSPCCGVSALARFKQDVLDQTGVREVILFEGINDIGYSDSTDPLTAPHTDVSAAQIIAGDEQLIARAHAAGLKIFGATLTPFFGAAHWTPAGEAKREAINNWIRTSGAFDGVIDFAAAVEDPHNPEMLNPLYDSGDHLHPNDAGYQAMAAAIDPTMLIQAAGPASQ